MAGVHPGLASGSVVVTKRHDSDISASKGAHRPSYLVLLDVVRAERVTRAVVFHTSRLWRNREAPPGTTTYIPNFVEPGIRLRMASAVSRNARTRRVPNNCTSRRRSRVV